MGDRTFEQGPIRPPSEAGSLLLRFTRNCPWNKCTFCAVYKGSEFSRRSLEEIKEDIDSAAGIVQELRETSFRMGYGGRMTRDVLSAVYSGSGHNNYYRQIGVWLYIGKGSVFIQDANSLVLPGGMISEAIRYLREKIPGVGRITSYARSTTLAKKPLAELVQIREAGLDRIHIGMESGSDSVLEFVRKGATAQRHIEGGRKVIEAGMELSEYIMPGLGGAALSREHALESARVLNAIGPHFIRLRSLRLPNRAPLFADNISGRFVRLSDEDVVREIRLFIESLDGIQSRVVSDHMMNLLNVNYKFNHLSGLKLSASASYSNCWPGEGKRGVNLRTVPETKSSHIVRWSRFCRGKPKGCMTIRLMSRCISRRSRIRRFTRSSGSTLSIAS